jgi:hypothetical protein
MILASLLHDFTMLFQVQCFYSVVTGDVSFRQLTIHYKAIMIHSKTDYYPVKLH